MVQEALFGPLLGSRAQEPLRGGGEVRLEQIQQAIPPHAKAGLDIVAILGWVSALAGLLTPIIGLLAALASLGWGLIRLYETKTVQRWLGRG